MGPPSIPSKPLLCYSELNLPGMIPPAPCTPQEVMRIYQGVADYYVQQCYLKPTLKPVKSVDTPKKAPEFSVQRSSLSSYLRSFCTSLENHFAVRSLAMGILNSPSPLKRLVPYFDLHALDDLRSLDVFDRLGGTQELVSWMKQRPDLRIVYPGSGSHLAPLALVFRGIDEGHLQSAHLTYTEVDPRTEGALKAYLTFMASQPVSLIEDFEESRQQFAGDPKSHETTFSFIYRQKPVTLVFAMNRGGDLWVQEEALDRGDLFIFHDSIYNNSDDAELIADRFIDYLDQLTKKDGKTRFVVSDFQYTWRKTCQDSSCLINQTSYPVKFINGFYGCGGEHMFFDIPHYEEVDGQLRQAPFFVPRDDANDPKLTNSLKINSSPLVKHHLHAYSFTPNQDENITGLLLKIEKN